MLLVFYSKRGRLNGRSPFCTVHRSISSDSLRIQCLVDQLAVLRTVAVFITSSTISTGQIQDQYTVR